jgi:hypothetical protein
MDDELESNPLFVPVMVIPEQVAEETRRAAMFRTSEGRLCLAILQNALDEYQTNIHAVTKSKKCIFQEAKAWFFSDDKEHTFSFISICNFIDIEPSNVRKQLLKLVEINVVSQSTV